MPGLNSTLHLDMLKRSRWKRRLLPRLLLAIKRELSAGEGIYGLEWGDPEVLEPLKFIRDRYVIPYVNAKHYAVEIGVGGGRWTRYMLGFNKLYAVDYHQELLDELKKNFNKPNMEFIKNNGTDFPKIQDCSIDYLFSFGTFVHLDTPLIKAYLNNMKRILKSGANVVIHYSDKTKIMAQTGYLKDGFSQNTPDKMRQMVLDADYKILEEDLTTMWHSSIIRFTI
ncbi:type 11 methyltransferase [Thioploca ingrica]|uniref:Type 11 methyltransferase n=1 Tax=Thioploca ingrica TaxID=40754 RepID=A0A090ALF7_9GAMM|nr:type 11 methyltransferase [Thioploca ingrica]